MKYNSAAPIYVNYPKRVLEDDPSLPTVMKQFIAIIYFVLISIVALLFASNSMAVNKTEKSIMEQARLAYENKQLNQALDGYNKIPQTSDYWVESIEEKAWTYLRMGDNAKALSQMTTLLSDLLAPQVGPEPYFLKTMLDYRLCNIKGIFDDFELFKSRFKNRTESIQKLAHTQTNQASAKAIEIMKSIKSALNTLKSDDFGQDIQYLPRFFYRDITMMAAIETGSERRATQRLAQLADDEYKEIDEILQKMHLLESQVVQQVFAYNKQMAEKRKAEFETRDKNTMVFPYKSNNDIWIDELDNFEAATTECPVDPLKGATL